MLEIIEELPGWVKLTGLSIPVLLIILLVLHFYAGEEVVKTPSRLEEIKENASNAVMKESTNAGILIVSDFNKAGKDLAKDVKDPETKKTVENSMTFAGIMLALVVILTAFGAVKSAFK